ncbi:hypothetical protein ACFHYQ_01135 [Sphaerimonospora cavernae]|uniref:Uncharacterized protein n=1 Tax=Sphaerimonospora cavernae TaxID=1740611 RepID=A0ABV6TXG5_9ACTN
MKLINQRDGASATHRDPGLEDTARALAAHGCLACRRREDSERQWLSAFIHENHTDPRILSRVHASLGFCPGHMRRLVAAPSAPWILPGLYSGVVFEARKRLTSVIKGRVGPCRVCEVGDQSAATIVDQIARDLGESAVRVTYALGGGLCLPHALALLNGVDAKSGRLVAKIACKRLRQTAEPLDVLAGSDADASYRAGYRQAVDAEVFTVEERALSESTCQLLREDIASGVCPLCRARMRMEWRYLRWLAEGTRANGNGPAQHELDLCACHLHDLSLMDKADLGRVVSPAKIVVSGLLQRLVTQQGSRGNWGLSPTRRQMAAMLVPLNRAVAACGLCEAARAAERRAAWLLEEALADGAFARLYAGSHGLCLRHVLAWTGAHSDILAAVLNAHLGVLAFELSEAQWKASWAARYEPRGADMQAWLAAAPLLDGRIYCGTSPAVAASLRGSS